MYFVVLFWNMNSAPEVKVNEIIEIGERRWSPLRAVVISINTEKIFPYDLEVAYDQDGGNLVKVEVVWRGDNWQFKDTPVMGCRLGDSESDKYKEILKR